MAEVETQFSLPALVLCWQVGVLDHHMMESIAHRFIQAAIPSEVFVVMLGKMIYPYLKISLIQTSQDLVLSPILVVAL